MPDETPDLPKPTEAEMTLLQALWNKHPATVREVMEAVNENRQPPLAYTTVLKFMQIMTDKRLVTRNDTDRTHTFSPAVPAQQTRLQMVGDLVERVFEGNLSQLVLQALGSRKLSQEEAAEIKKLLDQQAKGDA